MPRASPVSSVPSAPSSMLTAALARTALAAAALFLLMGRAGAQDLPPLMALDCKVVVHEGKPTAAVTSKAPQAQVSRSILIQLDTASGVFAYPLKRAELQALRTGRPVLIPLKVGARECVSVFKGAVAVQ